MEGYYWRGKLRVDLSQLVIESLGGSTRYYLTKITRAVMMFAVNIENKSEALRRKCAVSSPASASCSLCSSEGFSVKGLRAPWFLILAR